MSQSDDDDGFELLLPDEHVMERKDMLGKRKREEPDSEFGNFMVGKIGNQILETMREKMNWGGKGLGKNEQGDVNPVELVEKKEQKRAGGKKKEKRRKLKNRRENRKQVKETEVLLPFKVLNLKTKEEHSSMKDFLISRKIDPRSEEQALNEASLYHKQSMLKQAQREKETLEEELMVKKQRLINVSNEKNLYKQAIDIISDCIEKLKLGTIDLEELRYTFTSLKGKFQAIYFKFDFQLIVLSMVIELLSKKISDWNPLQMPSDEKCFIAGEPNTTSDQTPDLVIVEKSTDNVVRELSEWNSFFNNEEYEQLWAHVLLPILEQHISRWNPITECENAITFWKSASSVIPPAHKRVMLEEFFLSRIKNALDRQVNAKELYLWIFPWLSILGEAFHKHGIFTILRKCLTSQLKSYKVGDSLEWLQPWKKLLSSQEFKRLTNISLKPKLEQELKKRLPHLILQCRYVELQDIVNAESICPEVVQILRKLFFPELNRFIFDFVSTISEQETNKKVREIREIVNSWKRVFPKKLKHLCVDDFFVGEELINKCEARESIPIPKTAQKTFQKSKLKKEPPKHFVPPKLTFYQLLERYCAREGFSFYPCIGKSYMGFPLYKFGKLLCFIEAQCLWIPKNGEWVPVSLKECSQLNKKLL